ncbi:hypothetical protein MANY_15480 [Mycolicibacterium anyangense]|uniref:Nitroreductase n=1 Tax=Mycolicibacterium anyangense TaxID=1431246 RepID=A0A6N4WAH2_9MYCO|nr:nitroreductase family deazaflavin-dependent oxidoreductase [Mycolicibacterium anyangense]BBZ76211.1 hypothetical protein MANY_15480 [Mycolicibacterium anyangense]
MTLHYDRPGTAARSFNAAIRHLAELGISVAGSRALRVRGRTSGVMRGVVVNVLRVDGVDYVISPRGTTQWVRNARVAGAVEVGPRWRRRTVPVSEVADAAKPPLLQRYLDRWYWEVKGHIAGLTPTSTPDELRAAAPLIPAFALGSA